MSPDGSEPPRPSGARSLDELVERLRSLRGWAGVGYRELHRRVVRARRARGVAELPAYDTVYRCFQPGRDRLDVELVVEIAQILTGHPEAAAEWRQAHRVAVVGTETAAVGVAAALPDDAGSFAGREAELAALLAGGSTSSVVEVIDGMPGVGKTRLAVHAAHRLLIRDRYSVQLAVDLRGHDRLLPPADPAAVLDGFLRRLGVPGSSIPGMDLADRTAAYRRKLAGRRALILLDNAASADQVRPLLPGRPGCLVLVTSRRRLTDLQVTTHVPLDVFTPAESVELLRHGAGAARVDADPDTAARIGDAVGHLPLAVALVASRIAATPSWTLTDHLDRLTERRANFQLDDGVSVALALSYQDLPADGQRMLRLLALPPSRVFDAAAAAALAGVDVADAERLLAGLQTDNLVQRHAAGRCALHDLVRLFAAGRAGDEDPSRVRRAALTRLFDHYRYAAALAMDHYAPNERHRRPRLRDPGTPRPAVTDRTSATEWLETERANLIATAAHCADHGWPRHATDFSVILFRFLDLAAHYDDAETVHSGAARVASGSDRGRALSRLGVLCLSLGHNQAALDHLRAALATTREAGDRVSEMNVLNNLGVAHVNVGQHRDSLDYFERAADIARQLDDPLLGGPLSNIGDVYNRLRRYREAFGVLTRAAAIQGELGERAAAGEAFGRLGRACAGLGRYADALDHTGRYLAIAREVGHRLGEADALDMLGSVRTSMGDDKPAAALYRQALTIVRDGGIRCIEARIRNDLGLALSRLGCDGIYHHRKALAVATRSASRYEQARAHDGIAQALLITGNPAAAAAHWRQAFAVFSAIGSPDAEDVTDRLLALGESTQPVQ